MTYETLKRAATGVRQLVQRQLAQKSVQSFASSGGGTVRKTWRTLGFFLEDVYDRCLVYELLVVRRMEVCVLRVYWENPLSILYARKFSTLGSTAPAALTEASRVFIASAGEIRPPAGDAPSTTTMIASMPRALRGLFSKALSPVPPPVDLDGTPEAEPPP